MAYMHECLTNCVKIYIYKKITQTGRMFGAVPYSIPKFHNNCIAYHMQILTLPLLLKIMKTWLFFKVKFIFRLWMLSKAALFPQKACSENNCWCLDHTKSEYWTLIQVLTTFLSTFKEGHQKYCDATCCVN